MHWPHAMYFIRHIRNSGIFGSIFFSRYIPAYSITLRVIEVYSALCLTLAYSQPCHILSPDIFRTDDLYKTLWKVHQPHSEPCHRALFSHIQAYLEPYATLVYVKTWHTRNPGIFRPLANIQNSDIFKTRHIIKNYNCFSKLLHLRSLIGF